MKLSISNIGWTAEQDDQAYAIMRRHGFTGLEIAPTRIIPEAPYDRQKEAKVWASHLKSKYGFSIPSMQSIWYGRQEKIFGTEEEREILVDYTKKAIDFASVIDCKHLVFGCPRNRTMPDGSDEQIGVRFFKEIGDYAARKGIVIGLEANPPIYHTNYINDTFSALALIKKVDSEGFRLNLDVGAMIQNEEPVDELRGNVALIHHIHISEPGLKPIVCRSLHKQLRDILLTEEYGGFVSIEMGKMQDLEDLNCAADYVNRTFCSE